MRKFIPELYPEREARLVGKMDPKSACFLPHAHFFASLPISFEAGIRKKPGSYRDGLHQPTLQAK
jgi:hypothetical protein